MSQPARPNPAQLPTLTEVIELLQPTPVGDAGMQSTPRPAAPPAGSAGSAPIVTGGLASSQAPANWTPMTTVVVPTLQDVATPPIGTATLDLPVLDAVLDVVMLSDVGAAASPVLTPADDAAQAVAGTQAAEPSAVEVEPVSTLPPASSAGVRQPAGPAAPEVPTLTVVAPAAQAAPAVPVPPVTPVAAAAQQPPVVLPDITEAQLAQRVLGVVQKQIDGMIDFRLKEAMAPILARHSEALVRDLREELSQTMADVIARAVAQEMAKLRHR